MAGSKVMVVAAALLALLVVAAAAGEQGYNLCGINTKSLKDACGSYCKVGSTESSPNCQCCAAARGADVNCLKPYKSLLPSDINGDRAMEIPSKCAAGCRRA